MENDTKPSEPVEMDCSQSNEIAGYKAAEAVLALINAQPRTPDVLAIAEVIAANTWQQAQLCCGRFEECQRPCYPRGYAAKERELAALKPISGCAIKAAVMGDQWTPEQLAKTWERITGDMREVRERATESMREVTGIRDLDGRN